MSSSDLQFNPPERPRRGSAAVSFGVNFAAGMALCSYIGWRLDQRRGEGRIGFTLAGVGMGLLYGAYEVWKIVRAGNAPENRPADPRRGPDGKESRP